MTETPPCCFRSRDGNRSGSNQLLVYDIGQSELLRDKSPTLHAVARQEGGWDWFRLR
jgi:hypothetical protein